MLETVFTSIPAPALLTLVAITGYLLGSVPFGLVLCYLGGYGDIRKIGSGNIGTTNVLRTGNKALAFATLLLDSGKGAIAVLTWGWLLQSIGEDAARTAGLIAGVGAFLGHLYPLYLGFKGGKGVATTVGTLIAINWVLGLFAVGVWLFVAFIFRYSSLAAISALIITPFCAAYMGYATGHWEGFMAAIIFAAFSLWKHRDNMQRLLSGTESKISFKKPASPSGASTPEGKEQS